MNSKPSATQSSTWPERQNVEYWVSAIDDLIVKQKRTVFEIGDLLIEAADILSKNKFGIAVKTSGLKSKQTANNYMRVARSGCLRKPEVFEHLPVAVGALIDLAAWSDGEIAEGIRTRVIHAQSERKKLQKWIQSFRLRFPTKQLPPETARVVGYIMCDIATYGSKRIEQLQEHFNQIKLQFLDDDMFIAMFEGDLWSQEREFMLAQRVWDAYTMDPSLFVNPAFHNLMKRRSVSSSFTLVYDMQKVAPMIASGDHRALHKIIKFSKSDWKFFGVSETGYATLLAHFT